jgi:hypothetical protein
MNSHDPFPTQTNVLPLHPRALPALLILWEHRRSADAAGDDPWDHAVAGAVVRATGITGQELQTLIDAQLIDYATRAEASPSSGDRHDPRLPASKQLFMLTDAGAALMERLIDAFEANQTIIFRHNGHRSVPLGRPAPRTALWRDSRQTLHQTRSQPGANPSRLRRVRLAPTH